MPSEKVTVTARKTGAPGKNAKLRYIRIELADNGCIVETDYEMPDMNRKDMMTAMPPRSKREVFAGLKEAGAYISSLDSKPKETPGNGDPGKGKAGKENTGEE